MDSIIPFLDESETPFSQEDIIKARSMVRIEKFCKNVNNHKNNLFAGLL